MISEKNREKKIRIENYYIFSWIVKSKISWWSFYLFLFRIGENVIENYFPFFSSLAYKQVNFFFFSLLFSNVLSFETKHTVVSRSIGDPLAHWRKMLLIRKHACRCFRKSTWQRRDRRLLSITACSNRAKRWRFESLPNASNQACTAQEVPQCTSTHSQMKP